MDYGDYRVGFGRTAGTLVYEDAGGAILFAFDLRTSENPEKGKWTIELSSKPRDIDLKLLKNEDPERISEAFERTKQFALSRGYQVTS